MGWGSKKPTGAKPQPVQRVQDGEIMRADTDGNGVYFDDTKKEPYNAGEPPAPDEKPSDAAKAQLEWHRLKSQKGWTEATLNMLLYEFVQSKALFADLVKFARRR